ncbi:MAG: hypothetical protein AAF517_24605, partial [Planctomycetota bacterium]
VREAGRLFSALGDLLDAPALFVEGAVTLSADRVLASSDQLAVGLGGTVTAVINLPFFFATQGNVDLGKDADEINRALEYLEKLPVDSWRYFEGDERPWIFPPGTRVRASGKNLVWKLPSGRECVQAAEVSPAFRWSLALVDRSYSAQERSWGFVVPDRNRWDRRSQKSRVGTVLHEFYHQEEQMRRLFRGWTTAYWPAYGWSFFRHGWNGHWAEVQGPHAASVVDRGLRGWTTMKDSTDDPDS